MGQKDDIYGVTTVKYCTVLSLKGDKKGEIEYENIVMFDRIELNCQ